MKKVNVAVVGATGMVGRTFLKVLEERQFPIENVYFFSSKKSAGSTITFAGKNYVVEELSLIHIFFIESTHSALNFAKSSFLKIPPVFLEYSSILSAKSPL